MLCGLLLLLLLLLLWLQLLVLLWLLLLLLLMPQAAFLPLCASLAAASGGQLETKLTQLPPLLE